MRFSLTVRLLLSFLLVLLSALLPIYLYLRLGLVPRLDPHLAQSVLAAFYRFSGVAASVGLLLTLMLTISMVRPLLRIARAAQAYSRGEYTHPLPPTGPDEIGTLALSLEALARRTQMELVNHSADSSLRAELVRVLPVPLALLSPQMEPRHLNAALRDALDIDPATETTRLHTLFQLTSFVVAKERAIETCAPQSLVVELPWNRMGRHLALVPLPAPQGQTAWALLCTQVHPAPAFESSPLPEQVVTIQLQPLLAASLGDVAALSQARGVQVVLEGLPADLAIADANGRSGRVLKEVLKRAILSFVAPQGGTLSFALHVDPTTVQIQLAGLSGKVAVSDLDPFLAPLGGSVSTSRNQSGSSPLPSDAGDGENPARENTESGPEIWIELRRA